MTGNRSGQRQQMLPRSLRRVWNWIERPGLGRWLFGRRTFSGGRIQVYGCSPGCLLLMVLFSLLLTILLNVALDWVI
ncbi:MAG: hypothetical protein H0W06_10050 [Chloroflexia bacterium]|nr:hypothetical protein [Chloroflexia bacterium]